MRHAGVTEHHPLALAQDPCLVAVLQKTDKLKSSETPMWVAEVPINAALCPLLSWSGVTRKLSQGTDKDRMPALGLESGSKKLLQKF